MTLDQIAFGTNANFPSSLTVVAGFNKCVLSIQSGGDVNPTYTGLDGIHTVTLAYNGTLWVMTESGAANFTGSSPNLLGRYTGGTSPVVFGGTVIIIAALGRMQGPLAANFALTVIQGNAYDDITANTIAFMDDGTWPDLSQATIVSTVRDAARNIITTSTCTVSGAVGSQVVILPLSSTQTNMLTPGLIYSYDVVATLSPGEVRSLIGASPLRADSPVTPS